MTSASPTTSAHPEQSTPAQGALDSAGAGITGGYTGDSLSLKIIIAFLIGLSLYNAVELVVLVFVTFQKYKGVYFWSLIIAAFGIIPYALGFLIKFFQLLDPNQNVGYVAVVFLSVGWYMMVTGQSVVLWSRLHLVTNSRRVLRWTLYMIIVDAILFHTITSVLTFGSNANSLSEHTLSHFVHGYNIMEKIQMVGFFLQELIISAIYIKETIRLLRLRETVHGGESKDDVEEDQLKSRRVRKTMYQLIVINAIIIAMDIALIGVEFANLYLIETTLKGVVYSIKLKLEFAVLGKLVQLVRDKSSGSVNYSISSAEARGASTGLVLEKTQSGAGEGLNSRQYSTPTSSRVLDFVDPQRISGDVTHADPMWAATEQRLASVAESWEEREERDGAIKDRERETWKRRSRARGESWIDEEMDKHNIG